MERRREKQRDVVSLPDLAPTHNVKGGSGRRVFGADSIVAPIPEARPERPAPAKTARDLSPKRAGAVKGGRLSSNSNTTLVRSTTQEDTMATKKAKDLAPSAVKGGRIAGNDNMTLVRHAKPAIKKDLSPSKNPKGGRDSSERKIFR